MSDTICSDVVVSTDLQGKFPRISSKSNSAKTWARTLLKPINLTLQSDELEISVAPIDTAAAGSYFRVKTRLKNGTVDVAIPLVLVCAILVEAFGKLPEVMDGIQSLSALDGRILGFALWHLVGPALDQFTEVRDITAVDVIESSNVVGIPFQASLRAMDSVHHVLFISADLAWHDATPATPVDVSAALPSSLTLPVSLCADAVWVKLEQIAGWQRGDVIELENAKPVAICGEAAAYVKQHNKLWLLMAAFTPIAPVKDEGKTPMAEPQMSDNLSMLVTFEIDRKQMSLADLAKIDVGDLFDMADIKDAPVKIRANGTLIASGRLVEAEDRLAVQILHRNSDV